MGDRRHPYDPTKPKRVRLAPLSVSTEFRERLRRAAERRGMPMSDYIRRAVEAQIKHDKESA